MHLSPIATTGTVSNDDVRVGFFWKKFRGRIVKPTTSNPDFIRAVAVRLPWGAVNALGA